MLGDFMPLDVASILLGWQTLSHWAHLGGAAVGLLYDPLVSKSVKRPPDVFQLCHYLRQYGLLTATVASLPVKAKLLRPGNARPPLFVEACHLLAAQGNVLPSTIFLPFFRADLQTMLGVSCCLRLLAHFLAGRLLVIGHIWEGRQLGCSMAQASVNLPPS